MSDFFGAMAAGQMVSDAIFIESMGNFLIKQRADGALLAQHAGLTAQAHQLQANYNRLVDRYNALARLRGTRKPRQQAYRRTRAAAGRG